MSVSKFFAAVVLVFGAVTAQAWNGKGCISVEGAQTVDVAANGSEIVLTAKQPIGFLDFAVALNLIEFIDMEGISVNLQTLIDSATASGLDADGSFQIGDTVAVSKSGADSAVVFNYNGGGATAAAEGLTAAFFDDVYTILAEKELAGLDRSGSCK